MGIFDRNRAGFPSPLNMNSGGGGGGGTTSPLTTKGDIWGYSTTDARLPVGSNGQVLIADSAQTLGIKWGGVPAGGSSGQFQYNNSGSFSGISGLTYNGTTVNFGVPLQNNTYLKWRNVANSADLDILKLNSSNNIQLGSLTNADPYIVIIGTGNGTNSGEIDLVADNILLFGNSTASPAILQIYAKDQGNAAGIRAPDTLAANYTLTLPPDDGNSGEFLRTNGAGVLSWAAGGATPGGANTQVQFNNSGAFGGSSSLTWDGTTFSATAVMVGAAQKLTQEAPLGITSLVHRSGTTNARTAFWIVPNGTSTNADIVLASSSDISANYSLLFWGYESATNSWAFNVVKSGSATAKDIYFNATNGQSAATANLILKTNGTVQLRQYGVGVAVLDSTGIVSSVAPGASGNVLTSNGTTWVSSPAAAGVPLSSITAATGANSISNGTNIQTWDWSNTTTSVFVMTANSLTTGSLLNLTSSSASGTTAGALLRIDQTNSNNDNSAILINQANNTGILMAAITINQNGAAGRSGGVDFTTAGASTSGAQYAFRNRFTNNGGTGVAIGFHSSIANSSSSNINLELLMTNASATGQCIKATHSGSGLNAYLISAGVGVREAVRLYGNATATNNNAQQISFALNRTTNGETVVAGIAGMITDISSSAYKGALVFYTASNATPVERARIDDTGSLILTNAGTVSTNGYYANMTGTTGSMTAFRIDHASTGGGAGINVQMAGATGPQVGFNMSSSTTDSSAFLIRLQYSSSSAAGTGIQVTHNGTSGFVFNSIAKGTGLREHFLLQNTATAANNNGSQITFSSARTGTVNTPIAAIAGQITDITAGAYKGALLFLTANNAAPVEAMRIQHDSSLLFPFTNTAGGTTGNQTINKISGTVNFAAAATTLTVTNSLVTANSIVFAVVRTNDTTAEILNVVPAAGSFTINLVGAGATAETSVGFWVINQ